MAVIAGKDAAVASRGAYVVQDFDPDRETVSWRSSVQTASKKTSCADTKRQAKQSKFGSFLARRVWRDRTISLPATSRMVESKVQEKNSRELFAGFVILNDAF